MLRSFSWSMLQICLLCYILINEPVLLSADTLFSYDSDVTQLSGNNFTSVVHGSPQLWMVDFYLSWCGHCRRFAPVYSSFATSIKDWRPVIGIASVSCSDSNNGAICRTFATGSYPCVKLFPPSAAPDHHGDVVHGHDTAAVLRNKILSYLNRLLHEGRAHSSWPRLHYKQHTSQLLSGNADSRQVYIIVEDSNAASQHVGLMVLLDLLPLSSSVVVGRMRLEDVRVHGITERGLYTTTKFNTLYPIDSEFERGALVETVRSRLGASSVGDALTTPTTTAVASTLTAQQSHNGLHLQDVESGLYHSLWSEIPSRSVFNRQMVSALKAYINVLTKYLPADNHIVNFLRVVNNWLKTTSNHRMYADDWLNNLNQRQIVTREVYIPRRQRWTGCRGSQPQYRGYPCSKWMILHAVTVNAYIREANNTSYSPVEVIAAIRGYVEHFLGCRECAENFGRGAAHMLGGRHSARYLSETDGAVIWLWRSHNRANQHLRGDITEDPAYPKVQFPVAESCPGCHHGSSWNETAVLQYLLEYYGAANVIDDDIDVLAETGNATQATTVSPTVTSRHIPSDEANRPEVPVATSGRCQVMSSDWTPCSRSCDVGTSVRLTNDNQDCLVETQVRLCLIRPCAVRFPDWTRSAWHAMNCARLGHTYQLASPQTLQFGNCSTLTSQRWRVCGRCPPSRVTRRPVCCRPANSTTGSVPFQCPVSSDSDHPHDNDSIRGDVMVEEIDFCTCDDNCLDGEM